MGSLAFAFNRQQFAFERFDEEVVILNLTTGTYYALGGVAIHAWDALAGGAAIAAVAQLVADRYGRDAASVEQDLRGICDPLVEEGIFSAAEPALDGVLLSEGGSDAYQAPTLEKHADMEDLLTLDPIHDIDPKKGWPYTQAG